MDRGHTQMGRLLNIYLLKIKYRILKKLSFNRRRGRNVKRRCIGFFRSRWIRIKFVKKITKARRLWPSYFIKFYFLKKLGRRLFRIRRMIRFCFRKNDKLKIKGYDLSNVFYKQIFYKRKRKEISVRKEKKKHKNNFYWRKLKRTAMRRHLKEKSRLRFKAAYFKIKLSKWWKKKPIPINFFFFKKKKKKRRKKNIYKYRLYKRLMKKKKLLRKTLKARQFFKAFSRILFIKLKTSVNNFFITCMTIKGEVIYNCSYGHIQLFFKKKRKSRDAFRNLLTFFVKKLKSWKLLKVRYMLLIEKVYRRKWSRYRFDLVHAFKKRKLKIKGIMFSKKKMHNGIKRKKVRRL